MKVRCTQDHRYNLQPRETGKRIKELELDPKAYNGTWRDAFVAGEEYDVEDALALRLLRDYGPDGKRTPQQIKFMPADPNDLMRVLLINNGKLTVAQAYQQGYISPPEGLPQTQIVDPIGAPA